jgi:MoxR-like ATPase
LSSRQQAQALIAACSVGLTDRNSLLEAILLASVAHEHVLIVGPPGTAKSEAVRRIASSLSGNYFEYLLGKFTEPSELFGPVDLQKLQQGQFETVTSGMLPEADVVFLDEVFAASTAILNTLLGILNERTFRKGGTAIRCPLKICVGASNSIPETEHLAAFADRFLIRLFVDPIGDPMLESLLIAGRTPAASSKGILSWQDIRQWSESAATVDLSQVQPLLADCVRDLRSSGIKLSDRRIVRSQNLIAAAAALDDRKAATVQDLWTLILTIPTATQQATAREILAKQLAKAENLTLTALCDESASGLLARAGRLSQQSAMLLEEFEASAPDEQSKFRPRINGLLRDIDCSFVPDSLPAALAEQRLKLIAAHQTVLS